MADDRKIAVYGSTGYTGRLVARELVGRGADIVISGRNQAKLDALAADLGGGVATRAASVADSRSLAELLGDCAAVVNCAGPFSAIGEPVVAAAIASGTHYVDTTGEQLYMKRIFDAYGERARAAGVAIVPAVGFDYLPGDLLAQLVGEGLGPIDDITLAYYVTGMRATHGTMLSVLEVMKGGRLVYENGHSRIGPGRVSVRSFDFPAPIGSKPMVDYPSGEVLTVPRHLPVRNITSLLSASMFGPSWAARAVPALMFAGSLLARTPATALMRAAVSRLPEGPTDEQRREARFTVVARASAPSRTREGMIRGGDVYGLTAVIAAEAATRMIESGYDRAGVLAPAEAFDPASMLDAFADAGIEYSVEAEDRTHRGGLDPERAGVDGPA